MGRYNTGAWTTDECLRIELNHLVKTGYLVRGAITTGTLRWTCRGERTAEISISCKWPSTSEKPITVHLSYTTVNTQTGERKEHDQTIYVEQVASNLGRGRVLCFLCPASGRRCRILYKGYNCPIWKSRQSYRNRIYYPCQQASKLSYANTRFWTLENRIEKLCKKRVVSHYRGIPTRRATLIRQLTDKQVKYDRLRWSPSAFPLSLRRSLFDNLSDWQ